MPYRDSISPDSLLRTTLGRLQRGDQDAMRTAQDRQAQLLKPRGSLGVVEDLGTRLSALAGTCPPPLPEPAVLGVFAGDHGAVAEGVSQWDQAITGLMVQVVLMGRAGVNALARHSDIDVRVIDVGIATELPPLPGLVSRRIRNGTHNVAEQPAMSIEEAQQAVEIGISVAEDAIAQGAKCLLTGDLGIGNTTASAALISVFTASSPDSVVGRGAGIDDGHVAAKRRVIEEALARYQPRADDPLGVLSTFGGFEHAALCGFILGGAAARVPVILDGVIACAAALAAEAMNSFVTCCLIASHAGVEPGIAAATNHLGLRPLLDLDMRLGEGTGAALAYPIVCGAARVLGNMGTFADLGIEPG